jgi:transcriptional regulator with XRE-family HTH domain
MAKQTLTPDQAFARVLKELRLKKRLSQEALAFDSDRHRNHIQRLEKGLITPTLETLLTLAAALDVSGSEFVRRVERSLGKPWRKPEPSQKPRPLGPATRLRR